MNAMQCHRTRVDFELYLDGDLSPHDCQVLEEHLFACAACAAAVGEDVGIGVAIEDAIRAAGPRASRAPRSVPWHAIRAVAASIILLLAGVGIGDLWSRKQPARGASSSNAAGIVPVSELLEPWAGLASFTEADLIDAERDALRSRSESLEVRARRMEAELELVRPLVQETAPPERIVARLAERMHQAGTKPPPRPPREEGDRMHDPFRHVRGAAIVLRRDPERALPAVTAWLRSTQSPHERRAAVKLIALLRSPAAYDVLAAEVREGPARDVALDGLSMLRDPRSRECFERLMDDETLPLDPIRIKAAGGLHRLGDPRGLEFLLATFRSHGGPGEQSLRRRILFNVGANPNRDAAGVMPELLDGIELTPRERTGIAEWLSLAGMSDADRALVPVGGDRPRAERGRP